MGGLPAGGGCRLPAILAAAIGALFAVPAAASLYEAVTAPATDFSRPEAYERNPGGATTVRRDDRGAFAQMAANLGFTDRMEFTLGEAVFQRRWVAAPSSTQAADGLGPLYNARSCDGCHPGNGRGRPAAPAEGLILRLGIPDGGDARPDPVYGAQLQDLAVAGQHREGALAVTYTEHRVTLADGTSVSLRAPSYAIADPAFGDPDPRLALSPRLAPQLIGLGLLAMIDEADLLANADPDDADGDGISGRPNLIRDRDDDAPVIGRFGWKAGQPTLAAQNASALALDIGLSSPLYPDPAGDCTAAQTACRATTHGDSPQFEGLEVPSLLTGPLDYYLAHIAVPARRTIDDPTVLRGKALFYGAGCIACHTPKFVTATDPAWPALSRQLIWPYTDLLLHDMGDGLADGLPEGSATGREWRTPPLWGIGLLATVGGGANFLHDGRARTLDEAILWHGGEAEAARNAFAAMDAAERAALIAFLESL